MKAYFVTVAGMMVPYRAETRARAKYLAARDCHDAGWGKSVGELLMSARATRASEMDLYCVGVVEGSIRRPE